MKKTNQNKNLKNRIKIAFIVVLMLAAAVLISAGDIIFKAGNLDVSQDLAVSNKVGIGTASPLTNLHIKGTVPSIRLEDTDWQNWDIKATHGGGIARLDILRSGGTVNVMSFVELSGGGKMGIGTSNPQTTLHLKQVSGVTGIRMENDWQTWDIVTTRGNLYFKRAFGEITEMTLAEGGKLGIGTTNPTERIEVVGAIKASEFKTGDITFNDNGKPVWRMFEDENGLYVESLTTGRNYRVVLEEMK